ncbi:MAG: SusD/RagB family nutrient-binding outer membrane lipoprotein, partial [Flavitalea sp.]
MKLNIHSIGLPLLLALLIAGNSCTRDFDKLNTDPSLVTKDVINPSILFTTALKNSIFASYNASLISEYSGYSANPASGIILQDRNWIEPLSSFYRNYLINTAEVIRLTENTPRLSNEHAMARIWKVWLFHQVTDAYGDVPYSTAVKDVSDEGNQPVYDTQESIYKDMLNEL